MSVYRPIRKTEAQRRLDQSTWADTGLLHLTYDTEGIGIIETELLEFGFVYEKAPFFTYGVELRTGQTLVPGDFPRVSAGVREWAVTEPFDPEAPIPLVFYRGAYLWINITSSTSYKLRFRLQFQGVAFKNVEYFGGRN